MLYLNKDVPPAFNDINNLTLTNVVFEYIYAYQMFL